MTLAAREDQVIPLGTWLGYLAMCVGMFMAILDIQIVASSLPDIQQGLAIPESQLSWIQTAYLVAEIIAIPLTGWFTRLLTLRGLFVAAVLGFAATSAGCAASQDFPTLVLWRVVQGFCGGAIIPTVFTSVFLIFPERAHIRATVIGGVFAMMAPTFGPSLGGYITETYSWHWLFLINVGPGLIVATAAALLIESGRPDWSLLRHLDYAGLGCLVVFLTSLEIGLKEAPSLGWTSVPILLTLVLCVAAAAAAARRFLGQRPPLIDLRLFRDRCFAVGCFYSFVLGVGVYGSVYLLPMFLGFVRQHTPLEIGWVMMVSGATQLLSAPVAALMEKRFDRCLVTALGYALFAIGLFANGFETYATDFDGLFWPQVLRGVGVMLCVLPTTTLALEHQPPARLADASALFNLMRNLGGAIGIALIDTVLQLRPAAHIARLVAHLQAGDPEAALEVGLPLDRFHNLPMGPVDDATKELVRPLIERAAATASFNEAWLLVGALFALSLLLLPLLRRRPPPRPRS